MNTQNATVEDLPENPMSDTDVASLNRFLNEGVVDVEFTKLDGNTRRMRCTHNVEFIPENFLPDDDTPSPRRDANPNVKTVFDVDSEGWRSFRLDRVTTFQQVR